ncbi:MAG: flippase [Spirochaetes bacterium]|nr:flippase [Spirochaetota bacterium]
MSQLKRNAFYNTAYQIIRIIFPIITYPYVSRVLGPEGIGKVSYAQTFAEYFMTFSMLGLPIYAMREVSRSRVYPGELERTTGELLSISVLLTLIAFLLYGLSPFLLPQLTVEPALHWIFSLTILFNWASIDWFFQGIENYRYITLRNLFVRVVSLSLIFLLVRKREDYLLYGCIWALNVIVSSLWNLAYSYRIARPKWSFGSWKKHLLNSLPSALFSFSLFMFATVDTIMLGVLLSDQKYSVGIYNVAGRIVRIVMTIIGGINAGLIPRLSYIAETGDETRIHQIVQKSFLFNLYLSLPAIVGLEIVAEDLIRVFAGSKFAPAILTLRILSFELLFLGIENVLSQLMYSLKKEGILLKINLVALVLAILSNGIMIPLYRQDGAAIATVATRAIQAALLVYFTFPIVRRISDIRKFIPILTATALLLLFSVGLRTLVKPFPVTTRLVGTVLGAMVWFGFCSQWLRIEPFLVAKDWILSKTLGKRKRNA